MAAIDSNEIPSHFNKEFFTEALDSTRTKGLVINNMKIIKNTTGGNYSSDIYRAQIEFTTKDSTEPKTIHLLVKNLFENLSGSSNEHFMYTKILPLMNEILAKAGVEQSALSPKLYLARKKENETHVFDDLNALGYKICDRLVGFNFDQTKIVMRKLGLFHASSMVLRAQQPEIFSNMQKFFWENNPQFLPFIEHMIDGNIKYIADVMTSWPGYESIREKLLRNTGAEFERKFQTSFDKTGARVQVLSHSDLWIKNILILEDTKEVLDAIFIDYQACFEGSPGFDINNFLITSASLDVLCNRRTELINYYYEVLVETLKKCNASALAIKIPSIDDIHAEIRRTDPFGLYALIFNFTQTNLSEELAKEMDFAKLFDSVYLERNRKDMFSNPRVLETLKFELKRLDDLGVLD